MTLFKRFADVLVLTVWVAAWTVASSTMMLLVTLAAGFVIAEVAAARGRRRG